MTAETIVGYASSYVVFWAAFALFFGRPTSVGDYVLLVLNGCATPVLYPARWIRDWLEDARFKRRYGTQ